MCNVELIFGLREMQGFGFWSGGNEGRDDPTSDSSSNPSQTEDGWARIGVQARAASDSGKISKEEGPSTSERATGEQAPQRHSRPSFDPALLPFHGFFALCAATRPPDGPPVTLQGMLRELQPVLETFIPSEYWPTFESLFLSSIPAESAQTYIKIMRAVERLVERMEQQEKEQEQEQHQEQPRHMDQNAPWWDDDS